MWNLAWCPCCAWFAYGRLLTATPGPGARGRAVACPAIRKYGQPALATYCGGKLIWLDTVEITDGRISELRSLVNPEKLARIGHI
ncbi:hypothetical protein ABZ801_36130 [Actinomadura sp. NPDC047616]|uniref:hypothetical protein n=1 Tax=Actinomadura sp. NPDC047616 TaxID=3155914 RepID=UPI0033F00D7F